MKLGSVPWVSKHPSRGVYELNSVLRSLHPTLLNILSSKAGICFAGDVFLRQQAFLFASSSGCQVVNR